MEYLSKSSQRGNLFRQCHKMTEKKSTSQSWYCNGRNVCKGFCMIMTRKRININAEDITASYYFYM